MDLEPMNEKQKKLFDDEVSSYGLDMDVEVEKLKKWIHDQPHLPNYTDTDNKLKTFIFACKCSIERTKQKLDMYYSVRGAVPEFYKNRDPLHFHIQQALEIAFMFPLPMLTPEGYRVIVVGNRSRDIEKTITEHIFKMVIMVSDLIILEDLSRGIVIVFDVRNTTLQQLIRTTLSLLTKFIFCIWKGHPNKIKQIIAVNSPGYFEKFINNVAKPVLPKKIQERLKIHSLAEGYKPLHEVFESNILPSDFGGDGPSIETLSKIWEQKLISNRSWFLQEELRTTNEKLRPVEIKFDPEEVFGVAGSFRQLSID